MEPIEFTAPVTDETEKAVGIARVTTEKGTYDIEYKDLGEHLVLLDDGYPHYMAWMMKFTYQDCCILSTVNSELAKQANIGIEAFRHAEDIACIEGLVYEFDKSPVQSIKMLPIKLGTSWRMVNSSEGTLNGDG